MCIYYFNAGPANRYSYGCGPEFESSNRHWTDRRSFHAGEICQALPIHGDIIVSPETFLYRVRNVHINGIVCTFPTEIRGSTHFTLSLPRTVMP